MKIVEDENVLTVAIDEEMTIYNIAQLDDCFKSLYQDKRCLDIVLSAVSEIDSAGIQLLIVIYHERVANKLSIRLLDASQQVRELMLFLNLAAYLDDETSPA